MKKVILALAFTAASFSAFANHPVARATAVASADHPVAVAAATGEGYKR